MAVILVVDDEFGVAEILRSILEDEGHRVITAINGRAALERIAEERPDLVMTDYMMPIMDGPTLLTRVAAMKAMDGVGLVLMSGLPEENIITGGARYDAFLRKPFRIGEVLNVVEQGLAARHS